MRLISLKIKNFKTHIDSQINFTQLGSPILIKGLNKDSGGSNGAGKSSIFDAIEYALYGKDNKYLRNGEKEGQVELSFDKDGIIYTIVKKFFLDDYEIYLYKNNESFSDSKSEIEKYIRETLKISKNLFDQTIFQAQGFNQFFGLLSPKMKSEFIMELLEMEKWKKYNDVSVYIFKTITDMLNKLNVKKEMIESNIKELENSLNSKNEEAIKLDIEQKSLALKIKQETLDNLKNVKFIMDKKESLKKTIDETTKVLKRIRFELKQKKQELDKKLEFKKILESKKVNAIDETYRRNIIASALALEKNIAALQHELSLKTKELEDFVTLYLKGILQANSCPFCRRQLDNTYKTLLQDYVNSEKSKKESYIFELKKKIQSQENQRSSYAQQVENLEQQCKIYNAHIKSLEELNTSITLLTSEINGLESREKDNLSILHPAQEEYNSLKNIDQKNTEEHIKILEKDIFDLNSKLQNLKSCLLSIQEDKERIKAYKTNLNYLLSEIHSYNKALNIMNHIKFIFSQNGIQRWLFTNILAEISSLANSLISPINFSIVFQMEKQKKVSDGFKPVFDILVIKNKEDKLYTLDLLSGGERSMVHFAIRLAFSTIMAMKYNFRFMIIDEGFTDLDEKNRELVASMVHQLSDQFQIFLVTHIAEFENMFNNILYVERENNISRVMIKNP